jgi:hypothetical protein
MTQEQLDDKIETMIMQKKHLDNKSIHIVDVVNICEELAAYVREDTLREVESAIYDLFNNHPKDWE